MIFGSRVTFPVHVHKVQFIIRIDYFVFKIFMAYFICSVFFYNSDFRNTIVRDMMTKQKTILIYLFELHKGELVPIEQ